MHKNTLREVSKFATGLVAGDFAIGLWFYFGGHLPIVFFGMPINNQSTIGWMIFDAILIILLANYGWRFSDHPKTISERKFHLAAGILFTVVALLHFARILFGWDFTIGSWQVPYLINGMGTIVTGFLAYVSFYWFSQNK